jgi:hypothetical protein
MSLQCHAIAKSTKRQCRKTQLKGHDCCHLHVQCQGTKRDGAPCHSRALAKHDYSYCEHHCKPLGTDPAVLRIEGLHRDKKHAVLEYRDNKDAYRDLNLRGGGMICDVERRELDHVVELHIVRDAFDAIKPQGTDFARRQEELLEDLRDIVNKVENLNITAKEINQSKFKAFWNFQVDYNRDQGLQRKHGLIPYLDQVTEGKLTRGVSRRIGKEVVASYESIRDGLQDEKNEHEQVIERLHNNIVVAMKLK